MSKPIYWCIPLLKNQTPKYDYYLALGHINQDIYPFPYLHGPLNLDSDPNTNHNQLIFTDSEITQLEYDFPSYKELIEAQKEVVNNQPKEPAMSKHEKQLAEKVKHLSAKVNHLNDKIKKLENADHKYCLELPTDQDGTPNYLTYENGEWWVSKKPQEFSQTQLDNLEEEFHRFKEVLEELKVQTQ